MAEYFREDNQELNIYYSSNMTESILFTVYDINTDEYIYYGEGTKLDDFGFNLTLPAEVTKYDRDLVLDLQIIRSNSYEEDSLSISLFRKFITEEQLTAFGIEVSTEPTIQETQKLIKDTTYHRLERKARALIKAITNQEFKFEYKTVGSYGSNTDLLYLGQRLVSFDKITYDDYVVYDTTADPAIDELGTTLAVAPSKTAIKVVAEGVNISEWVDQNPIKNPSYFGQDSAYLIRGEYGWKEIPEDIVLCTYELINDMLCNDYLYRNKGIKSIQNDSFTVQYADGMLNGTGNIYVDTILNRYKDWNLKAI